MSADDAQPPPGQEIRLAVVLAGGVSLAVWMGGLARELNLLLDADDAPERSGFYRSLLELLGVTVRMDLVSGTSAGGINAALLGAANARRGDLGHLRGLWMDEGGFDNLLRDPADAMPVSLLKGDEQLRTTIRRAVRALPTTVDRPRDTDVLITTTLLSPEYRYFTDTFGTITTELDHRALFRFGAAQLTGELAPLADALALAGRSTASFPGAFEPAFLPETSADTTRAHWVSDGGLLVNRPIAPLLRVIFDRPADQRVRRVLLHVVPTNAVTHSQDDRADQPLSLHTALMRNVEAVLSQSIAAELNALREHNQRAAAGSDTRLRLMRLALRLRGRGDTGPLADAATWAGYRSRRGAWLARPVVAEIMRQRAGEAARVSEYPKPGTAHELEVRDEAVATVTRDWPRATPGPERAAREAATLGRDAFDAAKATVLELLHLGDGLDPEGLHGLPGLVHRVHAASGRGERRELAEIVRAAAAVHADEERLREVARRVAAEYVAADPGELESAWAELGAVIADAFPALASLAGQAERAGTTRTAAQGDAVQGDAVQGDAAQGEAVQREAAQREAAQREGAGWGGAEREGAARGSGERDGRDAAVAERLLTYLAYLGPDAQLCAGRLLDLVVAERAILPDDIEVEQPVELIQTSADTRTLLAPRLGRADDKLTGLALHRFAAFYRASWRANDWMWGRVDGAGWFVHLLLDPRHLRAVMRANPPERGRRPSETLLRRLHDALGLSEPPDLRHELAFLDDPALPLPASLPDLSMWVASRLQEHIVAEELDVVAAMLEREQPYIEPACAQWLRKYRAAPSEERPGHLTSLPIVRGMSWQWTPPLAKIIAKAGVVTVGAVGAGLATGVPWTRPWPAVARYVAATAYGVANALLAVPGLRSLPRPVAVPVWGATVLLALPLRPIKILIDKARPPRRKHVHALTSSDRQKES
ncbi:patatin-like protein [Nonomuraea sp. PA05]|uniref:patatin-like protein n=1 Tax=Nonomuraea sp. PA05 TaxID=2604466 RepID=UPI0011D40DD9|nr:patatin-like protein [Nonomuraea sp. PA05]TYB55960.1 patatin-like protein [Nonomuraea sp. PA05]